MMRWQWFCLALRLSFSVPWENFRIQHAVYVAGYWLGLHTSWLRLAYVVLIEMQVNLNFTVSTGTMIILWHRRILQHFPDVCGPACKIVGFDYPSLYTVWSLFFCGLLCWLSILWRAIISVFFDKNVTIWPDARIIFITVKHRNWSWLRVIVNW